MYISRYYDVALADDTPRRARRGYYATFTDVPLAKVFSATYIR